MAIRKQLVGQGGHPRSGEVEMDEPYVARTPRGAKIAVQSRAGRGPKFEVLLARAASPVH
jgi:hypothetical protein